MANEMRQVPGDAFSIWFGYVPITKDVFLIYSHEPNLMKILLFPGHTNQ